MSGMIAASRMVLVLVLTQMPTAVHAWGIGTVINTTGCHETMTAEALRNARMKLATAPHLTPTRDEAALISLAQFSPPADFIDDLAGMTLLFGVRDNDLKGQNPLGSFDLVEVHGNPANQEEHCLRSAANDWAPGETAAMAACHAFIIADATAALDGLDAHGAVDPSIRMPLRVYVSIAGQVDPPLPLFYVKMGQAMHALEDGFTHTYRTPDASKVTVVLNWVDWVDGVIDEARDGPPHLAALDQCGSSDPIIVRNYGLATQAATELLTTALDPSLKRDQKIAEFGAITDKYLTFQPGCTFDNNWCDAAEANVTGTSGCALAGRGSARAGLGGLLAGALLLLGLFRLRPRHALGLALGLLVAGTLAVRADTPEPAPAPLPPPGSPDAPVVPTPPKGKDVVDAEQGKEPGRDMKTPTVTEVEKVREDKRLGPRLGFALTLGGSADRLAGVARVGLRFRLNEKWIVGLDGEWNPWITPTPITMRAGSLNVFGTLIRRFPMVFERVNLRTTLHVGVSTLLFDVYGAAQYSTGPFLAVSLLGLDIDLGHSLRIVFDPEISVAMPVMLPIPLYYQQYRLMLGIQYGS